MCVCVCFSFKRQNWRVFIFFRNSFLLHQSVAFNTKMHRLHTIVWSIKRIVLCEISQVPEIVSCIITIMQTKGCDQSIKAIQSLWNYVENVREFFANSYYFPNDQWNCSSESHIKAICLMPSLLSSNFICVLMEMSSILAQSYRTFEYVNACIELGTILIVFLLRTRHDYNS